MIRTLCVPGRRLGIALATALALAIPVSAHAQGEPAMTKRAADLRETPADTGRSLASLPAQAAVTRLGERKGPWVQVRSESGQTGWMHLFDIGPAAGAAKAQAGGDSGGASNVLRSVGGLFSRGPGTTATSASGVRGLSAQDIANAQPNPAAVGQMEAMRQNEDEARAFAGAASLAPVAVEPLPGPARSSVGGRPANPGNPESQ
jgi:hypothetical protein